MTTHPALEALRSQMEATTNGGDWFHRQAGRAAPRGGEPYDWIADAPDGARHSKIICSREAFYGGTADYAAVVSAVRLAKRLTRAEARVELARVIAPELWAEFDAAPAHWHAHDIAESLALADRILDLQAAWAGGETS